MILQYQNELLALAAIFILLLIYLYIKQKTATTKKITATPVTKKHSETATLTKQKTAQQSTPIKPVKEQTVTPHNKRITKDDFKRFSGKRILLAEDNFINQKVILGVLGDSGIEVVVANDGQEALDILQTDKNFLIILMDAHMPRVDGFEATKIIRQNPQYAHITIVALSGDIASDDIKKMKDAGMDEHLEKPLKIDALYDILYKYANRSQAKQNPTDFKTLDIQRGLQICGNDVNFYHEILKEFLSTYSNSAQELELLLKNNKTLQADQLLLDIVGVSANIGANALTSCANDIKKSIKENDDINLSDYSKKLQELNRTISNYFLSYN
ncbi:response regulator [Sulfurimonas sp.]